MIAPCKAFGAVVVWKQQHLAGKQAKKLVQCCGIMR
jgi:hypothetical protein